MKAIVIGGSGSTGKELIEQLILDDTFTEIVSLVRRKSNNQNPKLKEVIVNFSELDLHKEDLVGDIAFSCLGTTLKDAGSKEKQWEIEFGYQVKFASIAKRNNINCFVLLSAVDANANSKMFYNKLKGSIEEEISKLNFNKLIIVQPASLIRPNSERKLEKIGVQITQLFNKFGILKAYQPLHVSKVAQAMISESLNLPYGNHILSVEKIIPKT